MDAAAAAKSLQSCPTLCYPIDGSPPGSPVPGILQARTLEWVAISFSNAWKGKVKVKSLSHVRLLVIPWIAAYQAPPSMGFSRQEYWSGVPLPSPNQWMTLLQMLKSDTLESLLTIPSPSVVKFHLVHFLAASYLSFLLLSPRPPNLDLCKSPYLSASHVASNPDPTLLTKLSFNNASLIRALAALKV